MIKRRKVVIVGAGFVGMSMAYSVLNQGGVEELVLIDIDKNKTVGEAMDLSHGLPYAPQRMKIKSGEYKDCKNASVVVITAGLAQKPGQTRLELTVANAKIVKDITEKVAAELSKNGLEINEENIKEIYLNAEKHINNTNSEKFAKSSKDSIFALSVFG